VDVKNKFFLKKIILTYFQLKNTLKNNNYHNVKHYLILGMPFTSRDGYQIKEYS